jgi:predicted enzyme related to lactoylglutathione lyase
MSHVIGIGGVFLKSKGDNKALAAWYKEILGVKVETWGGAIFRTSDYSAKDDGDSAWMVFEKGASKFDQSESNFIINYRVQDLPGLIANLQRAGIKVEGPESSEQGSFAWLVDPEGNKVELWEPGQI